MADNAAPHIESKAHATCVLLSAMNRLMDGDSLAKYEIQRIVNAVDLMNLGYRPFKVSYKFDDRRGDVVEYDQVVWGKDAEHAKGSVANGYGFDKVAEALEYYG